MLAKKKFESQTALGQLGSLANLVVSHAPQSGSKGLVTGASYCLLGLYIVASLSLRAPAQSQTASSLPALEKELAEVRESFHLPAVWAGKFYLEKGRLDPTLGVLAASGIRKTGEDPTVTTNDRIHLGSCTKAMTAVLIGQQISKGRLRFDSTLGEIFEDNAALQDSKWAQTTVRQLLEHRSGAPANAPWNLIDRKFPDSPIESRSEVLNWLLKQSVPTKRKFVYSNVGYCLLGHIVEKLEAISWEQTIQRDLFEPLGIQSAGFGPVRGKSALSEPWGHRKAGLLSALQSKLTGNAPKYSPLQFDNPLPLGPAGRCFMRLEDWAKFVALFATEDAPPTNLKIRGEVWHQLLRPSDETTQNPYSAGWILAERPWANGRVLNHAGSNTTWFCVAWVAPKKEFFVLVACNAYSESVVEGCDKIAAGLITQQ